MEWLPLCEILPTILDNVELSNGYAVKIGYISKNAQKWPVANFIDLEGDFMPIWWRPIKGTRLHAEINEFTEITHEPSSDDSRKMTFG